MKPKIKYSIRDTSLLSLLPKSGKKVNTVELARLYFNGSGPLNSVGSLRVSMMRLMKKVKANREDFRIRQSERRGPHPVDFWYDSIKS